MTCPANLRFSTLAPDFVGVSGANAEVRDNADVSLFIACVKVAHSLLVVKSLPFSKLIKMNILQTQAATLIVNVLSALRLMARVCDVCFEQRLNSMKNFPNAYTEIACSADVVCSSVLSLLSKQMSMTCRARFA